MMLKMMLKIRLSFLPFLFLLGATPGWSDSWLESVLKSTPAKAVLYIRNITDLNIIPPTQVLPDHLSTKRLQIGLFDQNIPIPKESLNFGLLGGIEVQLTGNPTSLAYADLNKSAVLYGMKRILDERIARYSIGEISPRISVLRIEDLAGLTQEQLLYLFWLPTLFSDSVLTIAPGTDGSLEFNWWLEANNPISLQAPNMAAFQFKAKYETALRTVLDNQRALKFLKLALFYVQEEIWVRSNSQGFFT